MHVLRRACTHDEITLHTQALQNAGAERVGSLTRRNSPSKLHKNTRFSRSISSELSEDILFEQDYHTMGWYNKAGLVDLMAEDHCRSMIMELKTERTRTHVLHVLIKVRLGHFFIVQVPQALEKRPKGVFRMHVHDNNTFLLLKCNVGTDLLKSLQSISDSYELGMQLPDRVDRLDHIDKTGEKPKVRTDNWPRNQEQNWDHTYTFSMSPQQYFHDRCNISIGNNAPDWLSSRYTEEDQPQWLAANAESEAESEFEEGSEAESEAESEIEGANNSFEGSPSIDRQPSPQRQRQRLGKRARVSQGAVSPNNAIMIKIFEDGEETNTHIYNKRQRQQWSDCAQECVRFMESKYEFSTLPPFPIQLQEQQPQEQQQQQVQDQPQEQQQPQVQEQPQQQQQQQEQLQVQAQLQVQEQPQEQEQEQLLGEFIVHNDSEMAGWLNPDLEAELTKTADERDSASLQLMLAEESHANLTNENKYLEDQLEATQDQLQKVRQESTSRLANMQEAHKVETDALKARIAELETRATEAESKQEFESRLANMQTAHKAETESLNVKIAELQKQAKDATATAEELLVQKQKVKQLKNERDQYKIVSDKCKKLNAKHNEVLSEKDDRIKELQMANDELENKITNMQELHDEEVQSFEIEAQRQCDEHVEKELQTKDQQHQAAIQTKDQQHQAALQAKDQQHQAALQAKDQQLAELKKKLAVFGTLATQFSSVMDSA